MQPNGMEPKQLGLKMKQRYHPKDIGDQLFQRVIINPAVASLIRQPTELDILHH